MNKEKFIKRAIDIHSNKYDYSAVVYTKMDKQVTIGCHIHGRYRQTPHSHVIYGCGCPQCGLDGQRLGIQQFTQRANKVHNDFYGYSNATYINNHTKLTITCPIHGNFNQLPSNHLNGRGCQQCANIKRTQSRTKSPAQFIVDATTVHGSKYDYSKVEYVNCHTKINIGCDIHGFFTQMPRNHINLKQGCPKCGYIGCYTEHLFDTNPDLKTIPGKLYLVEMSSDDETFQKIGITKRSIAQRFRGMNKYRWTVLSSWNVPLYTSFQVEQLILSTWIAHAYKPRVQIGGNSECFKLSHLEKSQLVDSIPKLFGLF